MLVWWLCESHRNPSLNLSSLATFNGAIHTRQRTEFSGLLNPMKSNTIKVLSLRNVVHWERESLNMPEPESTLKLASEMHNAPKVLCASDYGKSINCLREKGYTWNEIVEWLESNGVKYSMQAIVSGWRTWKRRQAPKFSCVLHK